MTVNWNAKWIWQANDGPSNTWMCFRKAFNIDKIPLEAIANIAVDSKYWLWINESLVVFEGGLNRGPTPDSGYYDKVDIHDFLTPGKNTIAFLVWYWGNQGRNNKDSGMGGLLFQTNLDGFVIESDRSWKMKVPPAYLKMDHPIPSYLYGGHNIGFDANNNMEDWNKLEFDDSDWLTAIEKGIPPCAPWNDLWERTIPFWKDSGLKKFVGTTTQNYEDGIIINAKLPFASQLTPYFKVKAVSAGLRICMRTDRYVVNGGPGDETDRYNSHCTEYITRVGIQEFESLDWLFGEAVIYTIPKGIDILDLRYRETGYSTEFSGNFHCNDDFYNKLYIKAQRTLYICMRDNFMDCPDRERGQWIGDVSSQVPQVFYSFDRNADKLVLKAIRDFINWKSGDVLRGNIPGACCSELPSQSLNAICDRGMMMSYYMNSGDFSVISESYTSVKRYLELWTMDEDGLIKTRTGDWEWFDHGNFIDEKILGNAWYFMALKSAKIMDGLIGTTGDSDFYTLRMNSISKNFDRLFWKGDGYRSGDFFDDRANAMAVLSGIAGKDKWESIKSILLSIRNSTPYMEGYVLEALFVMGYENEALQRMKERYMALVANENTTLWEDFFILGTKNHAWSGYPLALLCKYVAGVAPITAGYDMYQVVPQMGRLNKVSVCVPSTKGNIIVSINKDKKIFSLSLTSPDKTIAEVGIPKNIFNPTHKVESIKVGNILIWTANMFIGNIPGISFGGEDSKYIKFSVKPGVWNFVAKPINDTIINTKAVGAEQDGIVR